MIDQFFEPFCRLQLTQTPDGAGGFHTQWAEGQRFRAQVQDASGTDKPIGGLAHLQVQTRLLHEPSVTLCLHDRIRRLRDGAEYCVQGCSDDARTPPSAVQAYAWVPVERVVTAV